MGKNHRFERTIRIKKKIIFGEVDRENQVEIVKKS